MNPPRKVGLSFAANSKLPKLPVPPLHGTLAKLLGSLLPLARSADEAAAAVARVLDCLRHGSQARRAHQLLLRKQRLAGRSRDDSSDTDHDESGSWMLKWWNREAYLAIDAPLPINISYFMLTARPRQPVRYSERGGQLSALMLAYRAALLMEAIPPSYARAVPLPAGGSNPRSKRATLCMLPFKHLFHTCRVPCLQRCGMYQDEVHLGWEKHTRAHDECAAVLANPGRAGAAELASALEKCPPVEITVLYKGRMVLLRVPGHVLASAQRVAAAWFGADGGKPAGDPARLHGSAAAELVESASWLSRAFEDAKELMEGLPPPGGDGAPGLGALTASRRSHWARAWPSFVRYVGDERARSILGAAFTVCLDDRELDRDCSRESLGRALLHGDPEADAAAATDRWYDARLQLVTFRSGDAGIVAEHSTTDGAPVAEMLHAVTRAESQVSWQSVRQGPASGAGADGDGLGPARLPSSDPGARACLLPVLPPVDAGRPASEVTGLPEDLRAAAAVAASEAAATARGHVTREVRLKLGAKQLKGAGCSPDAFAQLAISLAWCIAHEKAAMQGGVPVGTGGKHADSPDGGDTPWLVAQYEPAQARRFSGGRTACIRSSTPELMEAVSSCLSLWRRWNPEAARRASTLVRYAMHRHGVLSAEAAAGHDVDRHLFGMQQALEEAGGGPRSQTGAGLRHGDLGRLLGDSLVSRSAKWRISTSNLTLPGVSLWGWGEVVPDGIGVAYSLHGAELHFHVCGQSTASIGESVKNLAQREIGEGAHGSIGRSTNPLALAVADALSDAIHVLWRLVCGLPSSKAKL